MSDERDPAVRAMVHQLVGTAPAPPDLVFDEAPSRRPRRARAVVVIAAVAILAVVAAVAARSGGRRLPPIGSTTSAPPVGGVRTPVALASGDAVRIVARNGVTSIRGPQTCCVRWSGDGQWIAFLSGADPERATGGDLVIARADGSNRRVVAQQVDDFGWSAGRHLLAVNSASRLVILALDGVLAGQETEVWPKPATSIAWAPAGDRLAVAAPRGDPPYTDALFVATVPAGCSALARCVEQEAPLPFTAPSAHYQVRIASWRPDGGALAIWPESLDDNGRLDGAPLVVVALDRRSMAITLGATVVQPDWVRWAPDGTRIAFVAGTGRMQVQSPRRLTVCVAATARCRALTGPGIEARDPAWSPDGRSLLYTAISGQDEARFAARRPGNWRIAFGQRSLRRIGADGRGDSLIASAPLGVGAPQFVDDHDVVFVHARTVQLLDLTSGRVLVLGPLVEPANTDAYWSGPHFMPDDHPYEGIESGPGGWSRWFSVAPAPAR